MAHNKKVKPRTRFNHGNIVKNKKRIESVVNMIIEIKRENNIN